MAEVLAPNRKDITEEFARTFAGMTEAPIDVAALLQARGDLIAGVHAALTEADRRFLLGLKTGAPDWSLAGAPQAAEPPAVQWKLANLARFDPARRQALADRLREVLGL